MGDGGDLITRFVDRSSKLLVLGAVFGTFLFLEQGLLVVPPMKVAVLIRKTGSELGPDEVVAAKPGQKGIQVPVVLEGWHFFNPWSYDWRVLDQVMIPEGKVGVRTRLYGKKLPTGAIVAEEGQRGIVAEVLRPGRHPVNRLVESVEIHDVTTVPPGSKGVVCLMAGNEPTNPNAFTVKVGERGVQEKTLNPGVYYVNPYLQQIYPVDLRSHRFDGPIRFPSLDGFPISLEGTVEWAIDPERLPEVFVKYVEEEQTNAAGIIRCIEEEVILPNARAYARLEGSKHLARDFISGITRRLVQDGFRHGVETSCQKLGIIVKSALVRDIQPPEEIAQPIRDRELAIRVREKYEQEKEREKEQKKLAMTQRLEMRMTLAKKTEADVSVSITMAQQVKQVAMIQINRQLEVARQDLESARNEAESSIARGTAAANVIKLKNAAEAKGLTDSAQAFGGGDGYVRYLLNQRLAPALDTILSNTEGPFAKLVADVFGVASQSRKEGTP